MIVANFTEGSEVHPNEFVTVNEYVPAFNSLKIALVVPEVPMILEPPGFAVTVHAPLDGKPLNDTLPVVFKQVGCSIFSITGEFSSFTLTEIFKLSLLSQPAVSLRA